jgi:hypothetical protein
MKGLSALFFCVFFAFFHFFRKMSGFSLCTPGSKFAQSVHGMHPVSAGRGLPPRRSARIGVVYTPQRENMSFLRIFNIKFHFLCRMWACRSLLTKKSARVQKNVKIWSFLVIFGHFGHAKMVTGTGRGPRGVPRRGSKSAKKHRFLTLF